MKSKSIYATMLFCSLTIFSWLILTEAHPVDDDIETSLGFTSDEVSKDDGSDSSLPASQTTTRPKRTVGFLRQLFPGISQIIDRKIQEITRVIFRVVGRLILRGGNRGGNSGSDSSGDSGGRRISITLPTYPPIEDEDDTEAPTEQTSSDSLLDIRFGGSAQNSTANGTESSSSSTSSTETPASTDTPESNTIVRKVRDVGDAAETTIAFDDDLSPSEASTKRQGLLQRLGFEMRKKRGSSGSGGGSGNFIFDLIRLVAGSGISPEKDEELNSARDEREDSVVDSSNSDTTAPSDNSEDNYSAGIPGPLTRLFVLANRGLSNLIQDLIIRLAQTGERIVNFKARLLTAII